MTAESISLVIMLIGSFPATHPLRASKEEKREEERERERERKREREREREKERKRERRGRENKRIGTISDIHTRD